MRFKYPIVKKHQEQKRQVVNTYINTREEKTDKSFMNMSSMTRASQEKIIEKARSGRPLGLQVCLEEETLARL